MLWNGISYCSMEDPQDLTEVDLVTQSLDVSLDPKTLNPKSSRGNPWMKAE